MSTPSKRLKELLAKWRTPEAWQELAECEQEFKRCRFLSDARFREIGAAAGENPKPDWIETARQEGRAFARQAEAARQRLIAMRFELTHELLALLPPDMGEFITGPDWVWDILEKRPDVQRCRALVEAIPLAQ